jgi:hypothetical protein
MDCMVGTCGAQFDVPEAMLNQHLGDRAQACSVLEYFDVLEHHTHFLRVDDIKQINASQGNRGAAKLERSHFLSLEAVNLHQSSMTRKCNASALHKTTAREAGCKINGDKALEVAKQAILAAQDTAIASPFADCGCQYRAARLKSGHVQWQRFSAHVTLIMQKDAESLLMARNSVSAEGLSYMLFFTSMTAAASCWARPCKGLRLPEPWRKQLTRGMKCFGRPSPHDVRHVEE